MRVDDVILSRTFVGGHVGKGRGLANLEQPRLLGSQMQHASCIEPRHAGYRSALLSCKERGV